MIENKNILIITAPFGNGHKMVADSLKSAFNEKGYSNVKIVDVFTESHPKITNKIKKAYLKSYSFGHMYSFFYYGVNKLADKKIMWVYNQFGTIALEKLVEEFNPEIIINTFPVSSIKKLKTKKGVEIPVFNVVTDFCVHKLWISDKINKFYLATEDLQKKLNIMNIPIEKTVVSGIPIRSAFENKLNKELLYKKYGFEVNKKIILICAGAFGVLKSMDSICRELSMLNDVQVAVVCGNNKLLKLQLEKLKIQNLKAFGYTKDIHELYKLSSCMITKPGGITLSEALAVQIPLILYKPIPGQEKENALFFEEKGAAMIANSKDDIISYVTYLTNNSDISKIMTENMDKIYNKCSTTKIVNDMLLSV